MIASGVVSLARYLAAALREVRELDALRVQVGPKVALSEARRRGRARGNRAGHDAARARSVAVSIVDRLATGGPNCYRRVLLESALDREAADRQVAFGLHATGSMGHAWFVGQEPVDESRFDAIFVM